MHPSPILALALTALAAACGADDPSGRARRGPTQNVVAVASGPARLVAEAAVGADRVMPVAPEGTSMATWRPGDEALGLMVSARRVLVVGAEFEPWLQRAGLPPSRTITLAERGGMDRWIEVGSVTHTHGGGEAHSHGGTVPTVWTDPALLRAFVAAGTEELPPALGGVDEKALEAGRRALQLRIQQYEDGLTALGEALSGRTLIATHHGLEYVARAAGIELEVTLLELDDPGGKPNDQGIRDLQAIAARTGEHAGVLVWPGRLDEAFAAKVNEQLGLVSVHFDLGATLDGADTLERLVRSVTQLRTTIREAKTR